MFHFQVAHYQVLLFHVTQIHVLPFRCGNAKIASCNRNNDELSAWSCVSVTSIALPAKTTLYT